MIHKNVANFSKTKKIPDKSKIPEASFVLFYTIYNLNIVQYLDIRLYLIIFGLNNKCIYHIPN